MRISVRAGGLPAGQVERLRHALEFAFGRFGGRIRGLTVRLTDVNGPRGGLDKRCLLAVQLDAPRREIVIEDTDVQAGAAAARAIDRAGRAVARTIRAAADRRAQPLRTF